MKLIDKSALVAEIERRLYFDKNWIEGDERRQKRMSSISTEYYKRVGSKHAGEAFLDFINSIEVKEVNLEKEIKSIQRHYKTIEEYEGYSAHLSASDIEYIARHFFNLGLKTQKGK